MKLCVISGIRYQIISNQRPYHRQNTQNMYKHNDLIFQIKFESKMNKDQPCWSSTSNALKFAWHANCYDISNFGEI